MRFQPNVDESVDVEFAEPAIDSTPYGERKKATLRGNSLARLGVDGSELAFSLVAATITARVLGPAGKGYYSSLMLLAGLLAHLFNVGLGEATIVLAGRGRSTLQLVASSTMSAITLLALLGSAVAYVIGMAVLHPATSNERMALVLASVMLVMSLYGVATSSLLLAQERVISVGILGIVSAFVSTILLWPLMVIAHLGVAGAVLGPVVGGAIALVATVVLLRRESLSLKPAWDWRYLSMAGRFGAVVQCSNLLMLMVGRLDLLLVYQLDGPSSAGNYSIALTVGALAGSVPLALAYAAFPRLARVPASEAQRLIPQLIRTGLTTAVGSGAVLAAVCPVVIPLLFGSAYRAAVVPTLLLIPGGVFGGGQWLLSRAATARGLPRVVLISYGLSLGVMLALDLLLIPTAGAIGAAIAALVSQVVGLLTVLGFYVHWGWPMTEFVPRPQDLFHLSAAVKQMVRSGR